MTQSQGRKPLEAEYVHAANKAALKALGDVSKRRDWGDSKFGSPVTTNRLCAEIARLQIAAEESKSSHYALVKALEEAKKALEPFANAADKLDQTHVSPTDRLCIHDNVTLQAALYPEDQPRIGDLRRAREAYAALSPLEKGE